MAVHLGLWLILVPAWAFSAEGISTGQPLPPSPADPEYQSGHHLYDLPRFTHYPAVVYTDEQRNAAFHLPVPQAAFDRYRSEIRPKPLFESKDPRANIPWRGGQRGSVGWQGSTPVPLQLPEDPLLNRVSGLLDLPQQAGLHEAVVRIGDGEFRLPLRLVDADQPWPHQRLRGGFPVDAAGVPVVLRERRADPAVERSWQWLRREAPPATGVPLFIGDPLAAPDGDCFPDLPESVLRQRPSDCERYPQHAALVALAGIWQEAELPRLLLWSPGNGPLYAGGWSDEEARLLSTVQQQCRRLGRAPRLVLLLPPLPVEPELQDSAIERRAALRLQGAFSKWEILDCEDLLGGIAAPQELAGGIYARYPVGQARLRIESALVQLLPEP